MSAGINGDPTPIFVVYTEDAVGNRETDCVMFGEEQVMAYVNHENFCRDDDSVTYFYESTIMRIWSLHPLPEPK